LHAAFRGLRLVRFLQLPVLGLASGRLGWRLQLALFRHAPDPGTGQRAVGVADGVVEESHGE
jgi:hypothetical protein